MKHLTVKVKPNAKQVRVQVAADGIWTVHLKAAPVEGKANAELIQVLSQHLQVPKSAIRIKTGLSARLKRIEVDAAD